MKANTPDLLACPFCGAEPVLVEHQSHAHSAMLKALVPGIPDHPGSWSIECCDVGMIKATRDEVVAAWNRRTTDAADRNVATWQERMPPPRAAYQCSMNCSSVGMGAVREENCGDCMPITIEGDSVAARDAEIADLRMAEGASAGSRWQPFETAPKDMASRLYLVNGFCVQGFVDATGELMAQSEVSPHWRKLQGKPSHWAPLPVRTTVTGAAGQEGSAA